MKLDSFLVHGARFQGESNGQMVSTCPFCGKPKLYIDQTKMLWICHVCGRKGGPSSFLEEITAKNIQALTQESLKALAQARGLPVEAFESWDVGWGPWTSLDKAGNIVKVEDVYTIPVRNATGKTVDIRGYLPDWGRMKSTKGCSVGLFGSERIPHSPDAEVWVCEGEWDTIATAWAMAKGGDSDVVVGVPGANTFKPAWAAAMQGRTVRALYDKDEPGGQGELVLQQKLAGVAKTVFFIRWPLRAPDGFDARDFVRKLAIDLKKPKTCLATMRSMFYDSPRKGGGQVHRDGATITEVQKEARAAPVSLDRLFEVFDKWLFLPNHHGIEIVLSCAVSNRHLETDPVWMFIVGPPSSAKSEMVTPFRGCPDVHFTDSLTANSLVSGFKTKSGVDPSLLPRLHKKILVVKDFTTVLSMRDIAQDEVFGILRAAFDTHYHREFGNNLVRDYECAFSIMAAVTPQIYELSNKNQALGERFLKFSIGSNLHHQHEDEIIERSIMNMNKENRMRDELADTVESFMSNPTLDLRVEPTLEEVKLLQPLVKFGSRMRGTVCRDPYRPEIIMGRPSAELGARLGRQLSKLGKALSIIRGKDGIGPEEYALLKKTILDTIPQRYEDIVRVLTMAMREEHRGLNPRSISAKTRYPISTVRRMLQDLDALDVVELVEVGTEHVYTMSEYMMEIVDAAHLWTEEVEFQRPRVMRKNLRDGHQKEEVLF